MDHNIFDFFPRSQTFLHPLLEVDSLAPLVCKIVAFLTNIAALKLWKKLTFFDHVQNKSLVHEHFELLLTFINLTPTKHFNCYFFLSDFVNSWVDSSIQPWSNLLNMMVVITKIGFMTILRKKTLPLSKHCRITMKKLNIFILGMNNNGCWISIAIEHDSKARILI